MGNLCAFDGLEYIGYTEENDDHEKMAGFIIQLLQSKTVRKMTVTLQNKAAWGGCPRFTPWSSYGELLEILQ
jgi:hypothetical protein